MSRTPSNIQLNQADDTARDQILNRKIQDHQNKENAMRKIISLVKRRGIDLLGAKSEGELDKSLINNLFSSNNRYHNEVIEGDRLIFGKWVNGIVEVIDEDGNISFLNKKFASAVDHPSEDASTPPLCIPNGQPQKYLGKKNSGPIYDFLEKVYAYREGRERLTIGFLSSYDPQAHRAFYNRQRIEAVPPSLGQLKERTTGQGSQTQVLEKYGVDLATDEGIADARRLASAILHRLYPR